MPHILRDLFKLPAQFTFASPPTCLHTEHLSIIPNLFSQTNKKAMYDTRQHAHRSPIYIFATSTQACQVPNFKSASCISVHLAAAVNMHTRLKSLTFTRRTADLHPKQQSTSFRPRQHTFPHSLNPQTYIAIAPIRRVSLHPTPPLPPPMTLISFSVPLPPQNSIRQNPNQPTLSLSRPGLKRNMGFGWVCALFLDTTT